VAGPGSGRRWERTVSSAPTHPGGTLLSVLRSWGVGKLLIAFEEGDG
jgi:hypothetical protein